MTVYPGFSTVRMDAVFSLPSRVAAMAGVEAAVAGAQGVAGDIPESDALAIIAACAVPFDPGVLALGWQAGTPLLPLLDALKSRLPKATHPYVHHGLTTQDVVDTATMCLSCQALNHLGELATDAAAALRRIIERSGSAATEARSFLQPADVTTVGFRVARWLDQLDRARTVLESTETPVQLGGLIGDRLSLPDDVVDGVAERLGLDSRSPWHSDRAPVIGIVNAVTDLARWAAKVGVDIAQLVQLGEISTRAGGSSAAGGKRNPIDAMRATAAAEACVGVATVILHAKPHELERGIGSWHAEWFALPLVFQTAAAALEAIGAALGSLEVEPSALVVADDRRIAADAYVTSVLEQSP